MKQIRVYFNVCGKYCQNIMISKSFARTIGVLHKDARVKIYLASVEARRPVVLKNEVRKSECESKKLRKLEI